MVDMSDHLDALHLFHNIDDDGSSQVPAEKLDELKRRWAIFPQPESAIFLVLYLIIMYNKIFWKVTQIKVTHEKH